MTSVNSGILASASQPLPSLLDGMEPQSAGSPALGAGGAPPKPKRQFKLGVPFKLDVRLKTWWNGRMEDPEKRKQTQRWGKVMAGVGAVGLVVGAYFALRPVPQPDYLDGPMDDVFNYTLLTDEFNNLPIDERMKLIGMLVQRLKSMSSGDSVMMAGFAAGIAGAARKQIEENASRLAIDMWDKYAKDYNGIPNDEKSNYLDKTFLDFVKAMEAVAGEPSDKSDEDRLADVRKQAQRDRDRMGQTGRAPRGQDLSRVMRFMDSNVGGNATPEQRSRGALMMRDMVRHFRNQDPSTGKPVGPK